MNTYDRIKRIKSISREIQGIASGINACETVGELNDLYLELEKGYLEMKELVDGLKLLRNQPKEER